MNPSIKPMIHKHLDEVRPALEAEGYKVVIIDNTDLHELHKRYGMEGWNRVYDAGHEVSQRVQFPFTGCDGSTLYYFRGHSGTSA